MGEARTLRLRFTRIAARELDEVLSNVAERSPQGARAVRARIQTVVELLREHPHSGQLTSQPRLRRIVVVPYPYLVFYEVRGVEVIVVAVRHAARDPAGMPG